MRKNVTEIKIVPSAAV